LWETIIQKTREKEEQGEKEDNGNNSFVTPKVTW
jgi:hypothetical protein